MEIMATKARPGQIILQLLVFIKIDRNAQGKSKFLEARQIMIKNPLLFKLGRGLFKFIKINSKT